jgi:hypothetical protein
MVKHITSNMNTNVIEPVLATPIEPVIVTTIEPVIVTTIEPVIVTTIEPVIVTTIEPVIVTTIEPVIVTTIEPVIVTPIEHGGHRSPQERLISLLNRMRDFINDNMSFQSMDDYMVQIDSLLVSINTQTMANIERNFDELMISIIESKDTLVSIDRKIEKMLVGLGGETPIAPSFN